MEDFKDKIKSINFGQAKGRRPKVTTDVHDHHTVDVTEHWHDRQDVTVKPETLHITKEQIQEVREQRGH